MWTRILSVAVSLAALLGPQSASAEVSGRRLYHCHVVASSEDFPNGLGRPWINDVGFVSFHALGDQFQSQVVLSTTTDAGPAGTIRSPFVVLAEGSSIEETVMIHDSSRAVVFYGIDDDSKQVIWEAAPDGSVSRLLEVGIPLPSDPDGTFTGSREPVVSGGQVLLLGGEKGGRSGIYSLTFGPPSLEREVQPAPTNLSAAPEDANVWAVDGGPSGFTVSQSLPAGAMPPAFPQLFSVRGSPISVLAYLDAAQNPADGQGAYVNGVEYGTTADIGLGFSNISLNADGHLLMAGGFDFVWGDGESLEAVACVNFQEIFGGSLVDVSIADRAINRSGQIALLSDGDRFARVIVAQPNRIENPRFRTAEQLSPWIPDEDKDVTWSDFQAAFPDTDSGSARIGTGTAGPQGIGLSGCALADALPLAISADVLVPFDFSGNAVAGILWTFYDDVTCSGSVLGGGEETLVVGNGMGERIQARTTGGAGALSVRLRLARMSGSQASALHFDDIFVGAAVPEPGAPALALAALGTLALIARRRVAISTV